MPAFLSPGSRAALEASLPGYLNGQRWFGGKGRPLASVLVADAIPLPGAEPAALLLVRADYRDGEVETYLLCAARFEGGPLQDGLTQPGAREALFRTLREGRSLPGAHGRIRGEPAPALGSDRALGPPPATSRLATVEQSNSSIVFGERWILKLYRRVEPGLNPELEMCRALSLRTEFTQVPPLGGAIAYLPERGEPSTLAVLHGLVPNQGDAWAHALNEARRFIAGASAQDAGLIERYRDAARLLGRRVAGLHLALSRIAEDPDFRPEPLTAQRRRSWREAMLARARSALSLLREQPLPPALRPGAEALLASEGDVLSRFDGVLRAREGSLCIRIHGDLHLGQVLRTADDFCIIDFEGEPARPMSERKAKDSPLRDVAGMMRSFSYAAGTALRGNDARPGDSALALRARNWAEAARREFLSAYGDSVAGTPLSPEGTPGLLDAFLLDKAFYELAYELNNRPDWVAVPLQWMIESLKG